MLAGVRLHQVVVGPGVEQPDDLRLLVAGGGDDDRVAVTARIIFRACWPSRSGRPRSRTITSGACWLTSLIPSSAVPTVRTACARSVRSAAIADRTNGSSSIMSARAMSGTLCISRPACGIIADMTRALTGLAAWLAGTALALPAHLLVRFGLANRATLSSTARGRWIFRLSVGAHGLPLMGTGDWNDGMNRVGQDGKGESVWLGWFLHTVLWEFAKIADARGQGEHPEVWRLHVSALKAALEREGWDGR